MSNGRAANGVREASPGADVVWAKARIVGGQNSGIDRRAKIDVTCSRDGVSGHI